MKKSLASVLSVLMVCILALTAAPFSVAEAEEYEDVTLQVYGYANNRGNWEGYIGDFVYEQTGVRLEMIEASIEKTQALLASGDLPDIGNFQVDGNVDTAIQGDLLVNLDEYLAAGKIPNLTENWPKAISYIRETKSAGTGSVYCIPLEMGIYDNYPNDTGTQSIKLRWDAYTAIGAPEIGSFENLIEVLKQMQEKFPTTADGLKCYGWSLFGAGWGAGGTNLIGSANQIMSVQGYRSAFANTFLELDLKADEYKPVNMIDRDSEFAYALHILFMANQAGIMDPDSMTMTYDQLRAKIGAGSPLSVMCGQYTGPYNTVDHMNDPDNPSAYLEVVEDWLYPVATAPMDFGGGNRLSVSKNCKDIDAACRFFNLLYDYDACLTLYNGPKGGMWDIVDGQLVSTEGFTSFLQTSSFTLESGEVLQSGNWWGAWGLSNGTVHPQYNNVLRQTNWKEAALYQNNTLVNKAWRETYNNEWDLPIDAFKAWGNHISDTRIPDFMPAMDDDTKMLREGVLNVICAEGFKAIFAKDETEFWSIFDGMVLQAKDLGLDEVNQWGLDAWAKAVETVASF